LIITKNQHACIEFQVVLGDAMQHAWWCKQEAVQNCVLFWIS